MGAVVLWFLAERVDLNLGAHANDASSINSRSLGSCQHLVPLPGPRRWLHEPQVSRLERQPPLRSLKLDAPPPSVRHVRDNLAARTIVLGRAEKVVNFNVRTDGKDAGLLSTSDTSSSIRTQLLLLTQGWKSEISQDSP